MKLPTSQIDATTATEKTRADDEQNPKSASGPERYIQVGSTVLVTLDRDEGWWEAKVVDDKGDGILVLQWPDVEEWPLFLRNRTQVTLLPPYYVD
jgi:hypothetical protein